MYDQEDVSCDKRLCSPSETVLTILEFYREAVPVNWLGGEGYVLLMPRPFVVIHLFFSSEHAPEMGELSWRSLTGCLLDAWTWR